MSTEVQTETKPAKPKPAPAPESTKPSTIAVQCLTFFQPHPCLGASSSISAEPAIHKRKVAIEFVPALRHHRIEIHAPDKKARILFVYEGLVAGWEPLV